VLEYAEMQAICDLSTFEEYDAALLRSFMRKSEQLCVCTRPACGNVQETSGQFMKCQECGWLTCVQHKIKMHEGMTCEEYDNTIVPVKFDDKTKPCPLCKTGIEKIEGCDHMICLKYAGGCGAEFCWLCFALYTGEAGIRSVGNSAHKATCKHYRPGGESEDNIDALRIFANEEVPLEDSVSEELESMRERRENERRLLSRRGHTRSRRAQRVNSRSRRARPMQEEDEEEERHQNSDEEEERHENSDDEEEARRLLRRRGHARFRRSRRM